MNKEMIDKILLDSAIMARDYKFKQEIPVNPNPLKLYKWLKMEIEEVSEQINMIEDKFNVKCSCKKGCMECCKQLIVVAMPECLSIKIYIENLPRDEKENLKKKVLEQCEILEKHNITNKEVNKIGKEEILQQKYFELNMPCIFLGEENSCLIYETRPILCWAYRNYGDITSCKKSYNVDSAIIYADWGDRVQKRILTARRLTKEGLLILPFAVKKMMAW